MQSRGLSKDKYKSKPQTKTELKQTTNKIKKRKQKGNKSKNKPTLMLTLKRERHDIYTVGLGESFFVVRIHDREESIIEGMQRIIEWSKISDIFANRAKSG
jgi:YesN/AraC family two-component response regulator